MSALRRALLEISAAAKTGDELTRQDMRRMMGNLHPRTLDYNADAATAALDRAQVPGREYAVVASSRGAGREIPGQRYEVDIPARDLRAPGNYIHHSHPYAAEGDGFQAVFPLSEGDVQMLRHPRVWGIASYEPHGGTGYASAGRRISHSKAEDAINAAFERAEREMDFGDELLPSMKARVNDEVSLRISPERDVSTIAAGNALRRLGVLEKYSYNPGTEAQQDLLREASVFLPEAEMAALKAAHRYIYGLPHPFTWSRIGIGAGATFGGGAILREALAREVGEKN